MATAYDSSRDAVRNTIRNSMFRAGIVGRSLQQSFQNISEKEVLDTLKDQVSELNENSNTLSSIDTIAKRISNNVFALAKLMQKMYEMKVREKLLRDRERSRQEALQEEARFESQGEERVPLAKKIEKIDSRVSTAAAILGIGSLMAVAFKEEITQFIKDAEKWVDDTISSAKSELESLVEDGKDAVDESIAEYVNENDEEINLNKEEDIETEKIENEIINELEKEDRKLDEALKITDNDDEEEQDVTDAVPRETESPIPVSTPTITGDTSNYNPIEVETVKPESPESNLSPAAPEPQANATPQVEIRDGIQNKPVINDIEPVSSIKTLSSLESPDERSILSSIKISDNQTLDLNQPNRNSLLNGYFSRNVSMPQMLDRSNSLGSPPNAGLGNIINRQPFDMPQSQTGGLTSAQSFDMPLTQPSLEQGSKPVIGSIIDQSSFLNRMMRTNPVKAENNTTVLTSGNLDAAKPQTNHFVPPPVANRGSLELGVRFDAAN